MWNYFLLEFFSGFSFNNQNISHGFPSQIKTVPSRERILLFFRKIPRFKLYLFKLNKILFSGYPSYTPSSWHHLSSQNAALQTGSITWSKLIFSLKELTLIKKRVKNELFFHSYGIRSLYALTIQSTFAPFLLHVLAHVHV